MSQDSIFNISGQSGIVDSITGIAPIQANGVSGVAQTGNVSISIVGEGFVWNPVTSASPTNPIQIVAENGYICNGVSQVTFILPLAPTVGDTFKIVSNTATFQITENGAQQIRIGAAISTAGSGTITSNTVGDFVTITYVGSNIFISESPEGTLTIL